MTGPGVSVIVNAPPSIVYDHISDVERMPEWSPEVVRCRWLGDASAAEPGARFRGWSRKGWHRWSTVSTVVIADRPTAFAFQVQFLGLAVATWSYRCESTGTGSTAVTEAVVDERGLILRRVSPLITGSSDRGARNDETMHVTLERVCAAAEAAARH